MKRNKTKILIAVLVVLTAVFVVVHLITREKVPEKSLKITAGEESRFLDISKLN